MILYLTLNYNRITAALKALIMTILDDNTVKPVLSGHSKRRPKLDFKTDYHLMQVKSIAECIL